MIKIVNVLLFALVLICTQQKNVSASRNIAHISSNNNKSTQISLWDILKELKVRPNKVRTVQEFDARRDEYVVFDFIGLVEKYPGYTAEEHEVTTDDGYILKLHRITGSPLSTKKPNEKKPVYIQHGLFTSSDFMIMLGPEYSLAFLLADAGYDVWIGNVRGNTYSRSHTKYSPEYNHMRFWNFSMDHMATLDLPKFVDTILEKTSQSSLTYIGYSMGAPLSYMFLSEKPEYNKKINLVINLAPSVYFSGSSLSVKLNLDMILKYALFTNNYEVFIQSVGGQKIALKVCNTGENVNPCSMFLSQVLTTSKANFTAYPELSGYMPAGTSFFVVQHYKQLTKVYRKLQKHVDVDECEIPSITCSIKYDWALRKAAQYDMSKVTAPNVIFYAKNDAIVKESDAKYLKNKLKNVVAFEEVPDSKFNHLDFMWHLDAKTLVYDRLLEIMDQHVL